MTSTAPASRQGRALLLLFLALFFGSPTSALDNGLSRKPPLGFNTWNFFGCNISEAVVRSAADRLVSLGLKEAGYEFINIDDCWQSPQRGGDGRLLPDAAKFPSGMAALAADVHAKGLKFGIYSDAGSLTCAGFPGSRHHERVDAATFASWGVDFLKYDNCYASDDDIKERYMDMRDALNTTRRPIYYSMCNWGVASPWEWAQTVGNSWRTYQDISATWPSVLHSLDYGAAGLAQYAGPGGWNDPDMLEVGVGGLTLAQQRSHFALWAVVKAPLLIGANLDKISDASLDILRAKEVIAINQDDLGVAGDIIWKSGSAEVWAAPLVHNQRAVILFHRHHTWRPVTIRVTWSQLGYTTAISRSGFKAQVRDLYAGKDVGIFEDGFEAHVPSYDVLVLRVTPAGQGSGADSRGRAAAAAVVDVNGWRPWRHPEAAALQARLRAAAQRARKWDAWKAHLVALILSHRYLILTLVCMGVAAGVVAGYINWRQRRWQKRSWSFGSYDACPQSELSISSTMTSAKSDSSADSGSWQGVVNNQLQASNRV